MKTQAARYIPKGATRATGKKSPAVVYAYESNGRFCAVAYLGRAIKPAFHAGWSTPEKRAAYVVQWFRQCDEAHARTEARKAEVAAKRAAGHRLTIGAVLKSVWGYEQTNVDYYQVVALKGKRQVVIRRIGSERMDCAEYMQGKCVPVVDNFTGEPMVKTVSTQGDSVRISSYSAAYLELPIMRDGVSIGYEPTHWTAYA